MVADSLCSRCGIHVGSKLGQDRALSWALLCRLVASLTLRNQVFASLHVPNHTRTLGLPVSCACCGPNLATAHGRLHRCRKRQDSTLWTQGSRTSLRASDKRGFECHVRHGGCGIGELSGVSTAACALPIHARIPSMDVQRCRRKHRRTRWALRERSQKTLSENWQVWPGHVDL